MWQKQRFRYVHVKKIHCKDIYTFTHLKRFPRNLSLLTVTCATFNIATSIFLNYEVPIGRIQKISLTRLLCPR